MFNKKRHVFLVDEEKVKERKVAMALDANSKFKWTTGADVMATWRKHGFIPPTEYRNDYLFKLNREANKPTD
jgi:hypothetical protein